MQVRHGNGTLRTYAKGDINCFEIFDKSEYAIQIQAPDFMSKNNDATDIGKG